MASATEEILSNISDVILEINVPYAIDYSKRIVIIGSWKSFGDWKTEKGIPMRWTYGNKWNTRFHVDDLKQFFTEALEFKFELVGYHQEKEKRKLSFILSEKDLKNMQVQIIIEI